MEKLYLIIGRWGVIGDTLTGTIAIFSDKDLAEQFRKEFEDASIKVRGMKITLPPGGVGISDEEAELDHLINVSGEFKGAVIQETEYDPELFEDQPLNPTLEQKYPLLYKFSR